MLRYTLIQPVPPPKAIKDGREMGPGVTEVELRYPRAKAFVEMSKAGDFDDEVRTIVGLAKAIVVHPGTAGFSVDELWIGDIKGIVEAGESAGFFPSETPAQKTAIELLQKEVTELKSRVRALEGSTDGASD